MAPSGDQENGGQVSNRSSLVLSEVNRHTLNIFLTNGLGLFFNLQIFVQDEMRSVTSNGGRDETELENMMVEVSTVVISFTIKKQQLYLM